MRTAEDPEAGSVDGARLTLDEGTERPAITGEGGLDEGAVVHALIVPCPCPHAGDAFSRRCRDRSCRLRLQARNCHGVVVAARAGMVVVPATGPGVVVGIDLVIIG